MVHPLPENACTSYGSGRCQDRSRYYGNQRESHLLLLPDPTTECAFVSPLKLSNVVKLQFYSDTGTNRKNWQCGFQEVKYFRIDADVILQMRWSEHAIRDAVTLEKRRLNKQGGLFLQRAKTGNPVYVRYLRMWLGCSEAFRLHQRCHRIRAYSSGTATPLQCGITRAV